MKCDLVFDGTLFGKKSIIVLFQEGRAGYRGKEKIGEGKYSARQRDVAEIVAAMKLQGGSDDSGEDGVPTLCTSIY